jgi:electron-transferring-flavoprotein dehydrogenase
MNIEREAMAFDVVFVGGGPANLAGAVRLMQLAKKKGVNLEVALIEKGAEIGAHSINETSVPVNRSASAPAGAPSINWHTGILAH